jgi:hypothetical protein
MTSGVTQPSAAHRAALALHALAEADRAWLLEALSTEERNRLHPLLGELEELGIPRDGGLLETLASGEPQAPTRERNALEDLTVAGVRRLAQVLTGEPPRLIGLLVACRPWPWRDQLLSCLPPEVAGELGRFTAIGSPAGALQDAVVAEVCKALQESPAPTTPASRWALLRGRLAGFGRRR